MKKALFLSIVCFVCLAGCPASTVTSSQGSLSLILSSSELGAKTVVPPLDMAVSTYTVSGSGPAGASFSVAGVTSGTYVRNSLAAGAWTITVDAFNAAQQLIGSGSATVTVVVGETVQASVQVLPLSGTGTLVISISWEAGLVSAPSVTATLTPTGASGQSLTFTPGTNAMGYNSGNSLSAGYYSLALQVADGGVPVWGFFDAVRILKDQTTTAGFALTAQDLHTGGVNLTITPDMQDPIGITFSGQAAQLPPGVDMTISATTSTSPVTWQWYLNGVPLSGQTSASLTIGSSLSTGNYRLDLGVAKGNIVSAAGFKFSILAAPQAVMQSNAAETGTKLSLYFYGGSEFTTHNALYTIWVEDTSGTFLHNLFVCTSPGTNVYPYSAAWVARPEAVPYWTHKSCVLDPYGHVANPAHNTTGMYLALPRVDAMGGPPIPVDLDAVTGATRRVDFELQSARRADGASRFQVLLEIDQSYDYNSTYDQTTCYPGGQPSLVYGVTIDTNSSQRLYTMNLLGAGSVSGSDGELHSAASCTTALNIVGKVFVYLR